MPLPKTVCVPGPEQVCYRAGGQEQLESSDDGGQTWRVAWSLPASRRTYMERVAEGVLRGPAEWTRVGVGWAEPTPVRGGVQALMPPMIVLGETGVEPTPAPRGKRSPWTVAILIDFVLLTLMVLANLEELIATVLPPLLGLTAVITGMYIRWARALHRSERPADAGRSLRIAVQGGLLVAAAAWLPFGLWVPGLIPWYSAALWLGILAAVVVTTWCMWRLPKVSRPTPSTDQPSS